MTDWRILNNFKSVIQNRMNVLGMDDMFKEIVTGYLNEPQFIDFHNGEPRGQYQTFLDFYKSKSENASTNGVLGVGPEEYAWTRLSPEAEEAMLNIPTGNRSHLSRPEQVFDFMIRYMDCDKLAFAGI